MRHLQDLPVLVLGLGASGLAMARWCARHGAQVTVADTREAPPQLARLREELPQAGFVSGPFSATLVEGTPIRAVYRSPGLSPATVASVVDAARAVGLVVGGELDLFAQALRDVHAARIEAAQAAAPVPVADDADTEVSGPTETPAAETAEPEAAPVPDAPEEDLPTAATTEPASAQGEPAPGTVDESFTPTDEAHEAEPGADDVDASVGAPVEGVQPDLSLSVPTAAQPTAPGVYVPKAAREAAEFVARIAELSTPAALAQAEDEPAPAPAVVIEAPAAPVGYTPAVLAITGTNGKTTVTSLTAQLIEHAGKSVAVAGNIGPTLLDTLAAHIDADTLPQVWVLELSSFQLDGVQGFEPTAATVLNITQDHLDWHGDMASYAAAKARIFGQKGLMVLNRDDAAVMAMLPAPLKAKLQKPVVRAHLTFGADLPQRPGDFGIERINGMAWLVRAHEADETQKRKRGAPEEELHIQRLMPADALRIRGQHNALNALAALALAVSAGCRMGPMLYGLREYRGEPHRVEPVAIIDGVEFFDDSKGTNVGATAAALLGLGVDRKVIVILGGEGKGQDFSPLADPVQRFARAVVLIGRDAPVIESALADTGVPLLHAPDMDEAVATAARRAHAGDAVLLSPACASFDMFKDYAHRAEVFRAAVEALQDAPARGVLQS
ncbi:UDP-N-acetylmuramoylalanine--D-glutamate ligase [Xylophilus ampelinus]|nr:UDP-N-acetylmuramoyl-L-alanine--D-glutamate ligase [Variovorax sp.]VTY34868.1 UDP-N-acetylmuramoylalanine--D-glutamate ligase [Xylophilus ampelinus]